MKLKIKRIESLEIGLIRKMMKDFVKEIGLEYPVMNDAEIDKAMLEVLVNIKNPEYIYLIALDGKKATGFLKGMVYDKPYGTPKRVALAQELYVVPGKRGKIVGFKMVKMALELALELGAESFESIGVAGSTDKRWERFGFKPYLVYGYMGMDRVKKLIGGRSEDYKSDSH